MKLSAWLLEMGEVGISRRLVFGTLIVAYLTYAYIRRRSRLQAEQTFSDQHGCQPMETTLPYDWPLGLDILKKQYDALPDQKVLAFQSQFLDKLGPNMIVRLFGGEGYLTTDPKNIESILTTRFEGRLSSKSRFLQTMNC